jgi:hypothetical protein
VLNGTSHGLRREVAMQSDVLMCVQQGAGLGTQHTADANRARFHPTRSIRAGEPATLQSAEHRVVESHPCVHAALPSLIRSLMAEISVTQRRRSACSKFMTSSGDQWKW